MKQSLESFFWGIIAALGALVVEIIFFIVIPPITDPTSKLSFSQFFILPQFIIVAACAEEILKYIVISAYLERPQKNRLTNAFFIGLGFFSLEMALILITRPSSALQFLIEIALIHVGTAGLIGGSILLKNVRGIIFFVYPVAIAVFFHATYNLLSLERNSFENYLIFFLLGLLIVINVINFLRLERFIHKRSLD